MPRVKTYAYGTTSLLPADLNSMEDDYERGFAQWKPASPIFGGIMSASNAVGVAAVFPRAGSMTNSNSAIPVGASALLSAYAFWLDIAQWAVPNRTAQFQLRQGGAVGTPGSTNTIGNIGMAQVASIAGASGASPSIASINTPLGSMPTVSMAADTHFVNAGGTINNASMPPNWYTFIATVAAAIPAGLFINFTWRLMVRHV